jgi:hypothetical protein
MTRSDTAQASSAVLTSEGEGAASFWILYRSSRPNRATMKSRMLGPQYATRRGTIVVRKNFCQSGARSQKPVAAILL